MKEKFYSTLHDSFVLVSIQGGHEPGKPGILREFEKPQGIQGKLREFQCYSGNFVRMRNLRTFCRIFSFFKFTRVKTWLPVHLFWK